MSTPLTACSGIRMPPLLYGTAWKEARTAALVEMALTLGFRGIDTACQPKHYHEAGVGQGIAAALTTGIKRSDLYVQTKYTPLRGQDPKRIPYDPGAPLDVQVVQSFQRSLENLQTHYIDGLVLHSPLADPGQLKAVWQAMESLVEQGGVKQLGISNCYHPAQFKQLWQMADVKPAVLQNRFYADSGYDVELRAFCDAHGVIYQSFWSLTANPRILGHEVVTALCKRYQRTAPQIFFRYLNQLGILPLIGTTSAEHMRQDLAIFEFALRGAECQAIGELF
ncbi:MAG: aldo/keto reductase [Magnetococcales bacterium]|nr:aldo/keto reductase [Magnetococcales bacterium]